MDHPHLRFTLEVTATSGRTYRSGLIIQPHTADMTPDKVQDIVVQRLMDDWPSGGLFVMAQPSGEPICVNSAHIEAITVHWVDPIVIEEASHVPDGETEPPPAGEVAGGGVAADYGESMDDWPSAE